MLSVARAGCCCAIYLVAVASFHVTAIAAPMRPDASAIVSGPLTLEHALALASRYELKLRAAGLRSDAARARIADASRRPAASRRRRVGRRVAPT